MENSQIQENFECAIRPMRPQDIGECLAIWAEVEMIEGFSTVASTFSFDPDGFYVAEKGKEIIGMCAGPKTDIDSIFMGFYAVKRKYQGCGVGRKLWAATIGRAKRANLNIGLYGVPSMSEKYRKAGFRLEDPTTMLIFETDRQDSQRERCKILNRLINLDDMSGYSAIEYTAELRETLFDKIVEYDADVNGFSRRQLLDLYLHCRDEPPTTFVVVESNCQTLLGYGCIRVDNKHGGMIGPIYCNSGDICEGLTRKLVQSFELSQNCIYSAMTLSSNRDACEIFERAGLKEVDQCTRMFTSKMPKADIQKVYCIHSPNFTQF